MYNTKEFNTNYSKHNVSRLAQLMENPFRQFSASKIGIGKQTQCVVEYTDMLGKTHRMVARNRKQMREAQLFLSIFKAEERTMKEILNEYPIEMGRIPKRFLAELKRDFKSKWDVSSQFVEKIAGY